MTDALHLAIDNNVGFYRTVLGAHGIDFQVEDGLAYTLHKAPTYYSNAVTRSRSWRPDATFQTLMQRAWEDGWDDWSIKDSFAVLDLSQAGFDPLFSAEWLYLDPALVDRGDEPRLRFEIIRTEQDLTRWLRLWDADPELGVTIFRPALLSDPDFHFVAGIKDGEMVCGCAINRTGPVLGLSNCFAQPGLSLGWSGALTFVLRSLGPMPVVGYARGELADAFRRIGFVPVGPLQVWRSKLF